MLPAPTGQTVRAVPTLTDAPCRLCIRRRLYNFAEMFIRISFCFVLYPTRRTLSRAIPKAPWVEGQCGPPPPRTSLVLIFRSVLVLNIHCHARARDRAAKPTSWKDSPTSSRSWPTSRPQSQGDKDQPRRLPRSLLVLNPLSGIPQLVAAFCHSSTFT